MSQAPLSERYLIINADDFGLTEGVNRGIIEAHQRGVVTSASLMVRAPAAEHAATLASSNRGLGLGLHVDMGEWIFRDGRWVARYEYVTEGDVAATVAELESQVKRFVELTGSPPDHLDSHQHVHLSRPELFEAVSRVAARLGIGIRSSSRVTYRSLYGQGTDGRPCLSAIEPEAYIGVIRDLPAGITELGCHPGYLDDLESDYGAERGIELATLCDPEVREAVERASVRLITWGDLRKIGVD